MNNKSNNKNISAIVLAAGKSTRTKTTLPKVLHPICGQELILYPLKALLKTKNVKQIIIVVGYKKDEIIEAIRSKLPRPKNIKIEFVTQVNPKGTADAIRTALPKVKHKNYMIICGDSPLITPETLNKAQGRYFSRKIDFLLISARLNDPASYGRLIRGESGNLIKIKEKIDLTPHESTIKEVNSGMYFGKTPLLKKELSTIKRNPKKKEFFLTDLVEIFYKRGYNVDSFLLENCQEMQSVNTLKELGDVEKIMNGRLIGHWLAQGVRFIDPKNTFICVDTKFGKDTVVFPFVYIEKNVTIGKNCTVGPFLHIRKNVTVEDNVGVGNFLEVVRTTIKQNTKAKHFGYIGDATIGSHVNIGAGTVVANYDGKNKHKTTIGNGSFIGSDTVIVAPKRIGKNAKTGAGSVVTKNVKDHEIVVGVPAKKIRPK